MLRRDLIAASVAAGTTGLLADPATASEDPAGGFGTLDVAGVGLPVIVGGRIRNYVFVSVRLHLGGGRTPEQMRAKEAFFRDAMVQAAHRTPFVVADDWNQIDAAALSSSLMRAATGFAGRGAVRRVEVVRQAPRRRVTSPRT